MATYAATGIPSYTGSSSAGGFNPSPKPKTGTNAYGYIPGQIGLPNPYGDLNAAYPNLGATNAALSKNIQSELAGEVSPDVINNIKDAAATFGVTSGMPGSMLSKYGALRNLGLTSQQLQQQGVKDYNSTIPTISSTQTVNPALQAQIAETNAINAAAPDPTMAAEEQQRRFDEYLNKMMSPADSTELPWWQQGAGVMGTLPTGTTQSGPGTYHTPYKG